MNSNYLQQTYQGKKVFITGHTGFKGSWLITWLHAMGAVIKGYSLQPEPDQHLYESIKGNDMCESVMADVRNKERLKEEILSFAPDFVFHLAAQSLVRRSYELPVETFDVNVMGTVNVLDAIRYLTQPCSIIIITTDKVYHNYERAAYYKEDDRLGGYDPYSSSKAAAELIVDSYRNSFFHPASFHSHQKSVSVARSGNVIGGGDMSKDRIIPDIVKALLAEEPVQVRNPDSVRPWQHVLDPLNGYLVLGAKQSLDPTRFSEAFNFGPQMDQVLTVNELVDQVLNSWGSGNKRILKTSGQQPHEAGLFQLDISKAVTHLNWKPCLGPIEAIHYTTDWYKQVYLNKADPKELIISQIEQFQKRYDRI